MQELVILAHVSTASVNGGFVPGGAVAPPRSNKDYLGILRGREPDCQLLARKMARKMERKMERIGAARSWGIAA